MQAGLPHTGIPRGIDQVCCESAMVLTSRVLEKGLAEGAQASIEASSRVAGRGEQPGLVSLELPFLFPLLHKLLLVLRNPSRPGNEERTAPTLPGLAEAGLVAAHTQERLVRRQAPKVRTSGWVRLTTQRAGVMTAQLYFIQGPGR